LFQSTIVLFSTIPALLKMVVASSFLSHIFEPVQDFNEIIILNQTNSLKPSKSSSKHSGHESVLMRMWKYT